VRPATLEVTDATNRNVLMFIVNQVEESSVRDAVAEEVDELAERMEQQPPLQVRLLSCSSCFLHCFLL
jgi:hypothetical protein